MESAARAAEARLIKAGIQLTLGGEPTFVPLEPEGAEWSVTADGPTKLPIARRLGQELQLSAWPGSTMLYCPGKRYDGEVNPRWALRLITGRQGRPPVRWPRPCQPGLSGQQLAGDQGGAWLAKLGQRLGIELEPLPLRDPLDGERRIWAVPLSSDPDEVSDPENDGDPARRLIPWRPAAWPLEEALRELSGAPGPAGLRLPLEHMPAALPRQVLTLEIGADGWELFLPPLTRRPLETLLQAVADSLDDLAAPRLSGVLPVDADGHWQVLGLTADPGVLEINLPICHGWADYHGWMTLLEQAGAAQGLRSWKAAAGGRQESTGGGNHLLWGGPDLAHHPFFSRPAWLVGILRYWQHHPALSYLFSGPGVGPSSQAPRPDEAAGSIFDLELAYRAIEQADDGRSPDDPRGDHRSLIGETLRHLHADRSGNNHRCEISFDKFWNPGAPAGCLGLVEFRALESLPQVGWSSAIALLWSSLAAHLLEPAHRPSALRDWGPELHDRLLLPSQLWADLEAILAELAAAGLPLDPTPYRQIWEWRFPPLLEWQQDADGVVLRPALEPWPLICDTPVQGGFTSRFIDGSLRRLEVNVSEAFRQHGSLLLNGRPLPLQGPTLAVRYRHLRLYPCLHPAIAPQVPLQLEIRTANGCSRFQLEEQDLAFRAVEPDSPDWPSSVGPAWAGRQRPGDVTLDLRLE
ncbi:MAG: transglutaminase family protein [Cyanobacteria bacterium]|nr:transglutaminase family protein [Cyanobacteriota bacterium]